MSDLDDMPDNDADPRSAPFEVSESDLSETAIAGLIDEYCFRYHGLNETTSPEENRDRVRKALAKGDLAIWFDPDENTAALNPPKKSTRGLLG